MQGSDPRAEQGRLDVQRGSTHEGRHIAREEQTLLDETGVSVLQGSSALGLGWGNDSDPLSPAPESCVVKPLSR